MTEVLVVVFNFVESCQNFTRVYHPKYILKDIFDILTMKNNIFVSCKV